jgi:DNA-nicking Smr family endonuclease
VQKNIKFDAKIDLHGYTLEQAYGLFCQFVEYCFENEYEAALVITGKANQKIDNYRETINYELPYWCENKTLSKYIKSVTVASEKHGGKGAYYVKFFTR